MEKHLLNDKWSMWIHEVNDKNWGMDSYKKVYTFNTIEDFWLFYKNINSYEKYQFFLMRDGIKPVWEDEKNIKGGAYSYIISKNLSKDSWVNLSMKMIGETLTNDSDDIINGITYNPKRTTCNIKIWNKECKKTNQRKLNLPYKLKIRYRKHK